MTTLIELQNAQDADLQREATITNAVLSGVSLMDIEQLTGADSDARLAEQAALSTAINDRQTQIDGMVKLQADQAERAKRAEASRSAVASLSTPDPSPPASQRVAPVVTQGIVNDQGQQQQQVRQAPVFHAMTEMAQKPTLFEYASKQLDGNILNLMKKAPEEQGEGGRGFTLVIPIDQINLNALQANGGTTGIVTPIMTGMPVGYEGDMPDMVRMRPVTHGSKQWTEKITKAAPGTLNIGAGASAADLDGTYAKNTITVTRASGKYDVDNIQLDAGNGFFEFVMDELLSDWGISESHQWVTGDGTAPNQLGFFGRANTTDLTFSKGTNPEASYFAAVARGQGTRAKGGFGNGVHLIEPEWFWRLVNYRESGRPILEQIQNSPIPMFQGYGMRWAPVLGFDDNVLAANGRRVGVSVNLARNCICWVQRIEVRVLTEIRASEDETRFLLNVHRMNEISRGLDVAKFSSAA